MIEIGLQQSSSYLLDRTKIQEVIDELQANGFDVNPYYNQAIRIIDRLNFNNGRVELILQKGDFYQDINICLYESQYKKSNKIRFDCDGKTVKFDIDKVNDYYQKWHDKREKAKIRNNISKFKGDLLQSYVCGKFDEFGIEYKPQRSNSLFETDKFLVVYIKPTPSELVKLNMERVKAYLTFSKNNKEYKHVEIYLIPFLMSPEENMEKISEFVDIKESETKRIDLLRTDYQKQITQLENELRRVHELGTKLTNDKYKDNMKNLFYPKKKK
jgi:hypothetical protein